jgi:hypothetical protein
VILPGEPVLELLDIDGETELDMRTDGERLIIDGCPGSGTGTNPGVLSALTPSCGLRSAFDDDTAAGSLPTRTRQRGDELRRTASIESENCVLLQGQSFQGATTSR